MSERYHRQELEIALDPSHPAHILPPPMPPHWKALDIGCGAGQTLIAAYPDRISFGLDVDMEALKLGRYLTDRVCFVCGDAEALPWPDSQFDIVIARVSLAYTDLRTSVAEIRRVLKKGGTLWVTLNTWSFRWNQAKSGGVKGWIFFGYVVLNSLLFHFTNTQFRFFGRCESFQTRRGISRVLRRSGFEDISVSIGTHFLVTARSA